MAVSSQENSYRHRDGTDETGVDLKEKKYAGGSFSKVKCAVREAEYYFST